MKTISLQIPDDLDLKQLDFAMIVASKLYEEGRLSSGQAADLVGISKRTFIELLGNYQVSVFGNSILDLKSDLKNA